MDERHTPRLITSFALGLTRRRFVRGLGMAVTGGGVSALLVTLGRQGTVMRAAAQTTTGGIAEAINAFRQQNGLPPVPVSPELTTVAQTHIRDLITYHPDQVPGCNLHSWSSNGPWKGGCFTGAFTDAENHIMWDKPKEIANYPGYGYENMAFGTPAITADEALALWTQPGDPHRDVILNTGIWADHPWKALGGWVEGGYASAWFGEETDPTPAAQPQNPPPQQNPPEAPQNPQQPPANGGTDTAPPPAGGTTGTPAGTNPAGVCPYGPNQCLPGYVWRATKPDDLVCVTPAVRDQAADDNAHAAERVDPGCAVRGATPSPCPYGPSQCLPGYVWRDAWDGDAVCVTPDVRDQAHDDNAHAAERVDPACAAVPAVGTPGAGTPGA